MSEKSERLFEAMNDISDRAVDEAAQAMEKKSPVRWMRWAGLAAALVLVIRIGWAFLPAFGGGAGGAGVNDASAFMSYAGPIMPLTLREMNGGITAERDITLDFAPWEPVWISNEEEAASTSRGDLTPEERQMVLDNYNEWYPKGGRYVYDDNILVTDSYTLTNVSGQDQTVSVLYPFASSLTGLDGVRPALTLDGRALDTALRAGPYSGGFNGAWGSRREGLPEQNLAHADNWEDYKAVLEDGRYQAAALENFPDLSVIPVAVYEFTDAWGPEDSEDLASIRASFTLAFGRSTVLSAGFHGMTWDPETGNMTQSFTIPRPPGEQAREYEQNFLLVVLGEDIQDLTVQAYDTGGPDGGSVLSNAGVKVQRFESDLETVLRRMAEESYRWRDWEVDFELYFGLMKDELAAYYDVLAGDPAVRYADGWISESDLDFYHMDRVFYLEAWITIPAGGSVTLTAEMRKEPSYDFHCANTANRDVYGYDLVTRLGSNLPCTRQTAKLEDRGQIEIVRENFGFDLKSGVRSVELSPAEEHYYLEVKRIKEP